MKRTYNFLESHAFLEQARKRHCGKYRYIVDEETWNGSQTMVRIVCPDHGEFVQIATVHTRGAGCPKCGLIKNGLQSRVTFDTFLEKAKKRWGDRFTYFSDEWVAMEVKTKIKCDDHGIIEILPRDHLLNKHGCGKCGRGAIVNKNKTSIEELERRSNEIYGPDVFDFSETVVTNYKTLISVRCLQHGPFERKLGKFLLGRGCPTCKNTNVSKISNKWLDGLGIDSLIKEYRIIPTKPVDGYDPVTNTVYEFHSDFWHGNPEVFDPQDVNPRTNIPYGESYQKTLLSEQMIRDMGYNLVVMWEHDYRRMTNDIKKR